MITIAIIIRAPSTPSPIESPCTTFLWKFVGHCSSMPQVGPWSSSILHEGSDCKIFSPTSRLEPSFTHCWTTETNCDMLVLLLDVCCNLVCSNNLFLESLKHVTATGIADSWQLQTCSTLSAKAVKSFVSASSVDDCKKGNMHGIWIHYYPLPYQPILTLLVTAELYVDQHIGSHCWFRSAHRWLSSAFRTWFGSVWN